MYAEFAKLLTKSFIIAESSFVSLQLIALKQKEHNPFELCSSLFKLAYYPISKLFYYPYIPKASLLIISQIPLAKPVITRPAIQIARPSLVIASL